MNPTDTSLEFESRSDRIFRQSSQSKKRQGRGKLDAKVVYCHSRELLDSELILPTWGRQQSAAVESYEEAIAAKNSCRYADFLWHESQPYPAVLIFAHHGVHEPESPDKATLKGFVEHELAGVFSTIPSESIIQLYRWLRTSKDSAQKIQRLRSWLESAEEHISGFIADSDPVILERFTGVVEHIDGKTAFVTLTTESGEELIWEYSADEFGKLGICERRRFTCQTIIMRGEVQVHFQPIPDIEVTQDEEVEMNRELDELISGGALDGDY